MIEDAMHEIFWENFYGRKGFRRIRVKNVRPCTFHQGYRSIFQKFQSIVIKQNKDFTHERYLELYFFFYFINLIVENSLFYFNIYRYSVKKKKKEQHNCDFRCLEKSTRYISMFYLVVRICCLKELCNHISMLRKT